MNEQEEREFMVWWRELVRKAEKIVVEHAAPVTDDKVRLAAHAYAQGQIDEAKDATAQANARAEQLRAELRKRKGEQS